MNEKKCVVCVVLENQAKFFLRGSKNTRNKQTMK